MVLVLLRPLLLPSSVLTLALGLASGCPRQTTTAPQPTSPSPADDSSSPAPEVPDPEPAVPPPDPGPCADGGRLWDGKPGDCSYEHGGCCYDSAAKACAAASCPADRCVVLESYPAQIACSG